MNDLEKLLFESCKDMNIDISKSQINQFMLYKKLIIEWNNKINLTAITDDKDIIQKHFVDSISILSKINLKEYSNIIDVGTGAGFPGLPIKIMNDDINMTLLDSLNKRVNFLNEVITNLDLKNINCVHSRAEDLGQNINYREKYDMCVSRAVAHLSVLSEYCIPFLKLGGLFISLKGPNVFEELKESKKSIEILGGKVLDINNILIPKTDIEHSIILIKKVRHTPIQYPRKAGKITKKPIN